MKSKLLIGFTSLLFASISGMATADSNIPQSNGNYDVPYVMSINTNTGKQYTPVKASARSFHGNYDLPYALSVNTDPTKQFVPAKADLSDPQGNYDPPFVLSIK